ncbi:cupin domain-containing protein [Pedobacter mendelii]|nr:cupin domain-containing protein [Pedobacter mendelii]
MKRSSFFKAAATLMSPTILPFRSFAELFISSEARKGFKVKAGADRFEKPITLFEGDTFYTKVSSKDTSGDLFVFESSRVKKGGPALHYHYAQDEIWYVLEGEFLIKVGDVLHQAKQGDTVFGPRGIPHSFSKTSEGLGRMIMTFQPAGKMEEFFIAVSEGKLKNTTPEQQQEMRKAHGFESVGEGVGYQKKF